MDIIEWIPTVVMAVATAILAGATIYYAYTNHKLWIETEKAKLRPRKEDEINSIIIPLIS